MNKSREHHRLTQLKKTRKHSYIVYSDTLHSNRDTSEGEHKTDVFKISGEIFPHIY